MPSKLGLEAVFLYTGDFTLLILPWTMPDRPSLLRRKIIYRRTNFLGLWVMPEDTPGKGFPTRQVMWAATWKGAMAPYLIRRRRTPSAKIWLSVRATA